MPLPVIATEESSAILTESVIGTIAQPLNGAGPHKIFEPVSTCIRFNYPPPATDVEVDIE